MRIPNRSRYACATLRLERFMLRTIFATEITKNGFVTHRSARFFAEFACYAHDFFPIRAGVPQQRCATLNGGLTLLAANVLNYR